MSSPLANSRGAPHGTNIVYLGSGSQSPHHHHHPVLPAHNPQAKSDPATRLSRLLLFLEAQFGADNVSPVAEPKLPPAQEAADPDAMDTDNEDSRRATELERLHKKGIPVPGVDIRCDKMAARVWLENLEVECQHKVFADRVKAVVERACETVAPLWG